MGVSVGEKEGRIGNAEGEVGVGTPGGGRTPGEGVSKGLSGEWIPGGVRSKTGFFGEEEELGGGVLGEGGGLKMGIPGGIPGGL